MVKLIKIQTDVFPKLHDAFLVDDDPLSNEQDWRNVFDYQWTKEEDHCGYAMVDGDELVGMMGMVYSRRQINGECKKFCNLHTWWVREDYRGRSLVMLRPILKLNDYTITHFTPCDRIRAVTARMGFRPLSSQLKILLPLGRSAGTTSEAELTFDADSIATTLNDSDRRIFDDHQPYGVGHLAIREGQQECYLLYTHVVRHRLPYCHIHYTSNREVYMRCENAVRSALLQRHRAKFVAVDCRLTDGAKFPRSFNFWAPANALYRSDDVDPSQIDHLYSDVVFLKLTVLPDLSHEISERMRRWWPLSGNKPG